MGSNPLTSGLPKADQNICGSPERNGRRGRWIVQKFGGTSVGKFADNIAEDIVKASLARNRIAVVCSARSSHNKADGTTNRLLRAAREAEQSRSLQYEKIVDAICDEHSQAAITNIRSLELQAGLVEQVEKECLWLKDFLAAAQKIGEISPKSLDRIVSTGEKLSCQFITALLQDRGVDTCYVDLSKVIAFKLSNGIDHDFYRRLAVALAERVRACGEKVPIITGYFGTVPGGLLDQIGRGYTDLCAALVAVGLGAEKGGQQEQGQVEELQIWKEVDGIFTADPRKVPTARLLSTITPAEAAELTFYGSEVIHPFTMEQVIHARIPIRIKNVTNPRGSGTIILPEALEGTDMTASAAAGHDPRPFRARSSMVMPKIQRPKRPTAVTIKHQILVINVHSNKRSLSHGFFARIFSTLDKWRLSVDLISTSEVHVSMALHSESALASGAGEDEKEVVSHDLQGAIDELQQYGTVDILDGMAILSLVGKQMKNMVGIAGKMFSALGENNVNIEMISQGASEINISCVIEERDADRAINILHTNLFTFLD
ncbi:aspartokinase [Lasallia pustulata]|uniref:Aspartokinase n=1 Tax=Lasallia pustulata TaxID=136370 RepID=A0A1W5D7C3_9LECA|nr:aspartokinase [Lasallia pustulata]